jgi:hypothetical protein
MRRASSHAGQIRSRQTINRQAAKPAKLRAEGIKLDRVGATHMFVVIFDDEHDRPQRAEALRPRPTLALAALAAWRFTSLRPEHGAI